MIEQLKIVKVRNWNKYNPKRDQKPNTWFRFSNSFFDDAKIGCLDPQQKLLWIYLLSQCSSAGKDEIIFNPEYTGRILGFSICGDVNAALKIFEELRMIELFSYAETVEADRKTNTAAKISNSADINSNSDAKKTNSIVDKPSTGGVDYESTEKNAPTYVQYKQTNTYNPPKPPLSGGAVEKGPVLLFDLDAKKRDAAMAGVEATALVLGAVRRKLSEHEAQIFIGPHAWSVLMIQFESWERFNMALGKSARSGHERVFQKSLEKSFRALFESELRAKQRRTSLMPIPSQKKNHAQTSANMP